MSSDRASERPEERWIITGANGFLGANAGLFLSDRIHTIGLTRNSRISTSRTTIEADLLDSQSLRSLISQIKPSVILHCAALASHEACESSPDMALEMNGVVPGVLSQIASDLDATMIQISTDAVFDGARGHYSEIDTPNPFSVYGATKLEGELAVEHAGGNSIVARTNFFGWSPSGSRSILEYFVEGLRSRCTLPGYTDFRVSSLYVRDLIDVLWDLTRMRANGTFHVTSHDALSKFDFGRAVAHELCVPLHLVAGVSCVESGSGLRAGRDISLDVSKIEEHLSRSMPSQQDGVAAALTDEHAVRQGFVANAQ